MDTIVALATPPGRSALGLVRLSGPDARSVAERLLRFRAPPRWAPRTSFLAALLDEDGQAVDQVLVTLFPAPRSFTGEDVVEICCHGSPVLLRHVTDRACRLGARLANPGEFTLRAFLHGRMDLPQAEAVRDLIESTTLYQARVAARQVEGLLSRRIAPLKARLLELIALLEAGIDFAEDDVEVASGDEVLLRLRPVTDAVSALVASFPQGRLVREGLTLALVGRPNVGKSSLFNRLLGQERAIVTDVPGTTRDLVAETVAIHGIPVRLVDTAGIRDSADRVEALGIERSRQAMADADATVVVVDLSVPLTPEDESLIDQARRQGRFTLAGSKCDLPRRALLDGALPVSAHTGQGIEALRDAIVPPNGLDAQDGFLTTLRHEQLLRQSLAALTKADEAVRACVPHEMLLLDLYEALRPVDALTGATSADDILTRIFATFCIGK